MGQGSAFEGEDDLSDFYFFAFFYFYFFDHATDRGRHFDDGFVGFQFHHRLALGNFGAGRDHEADEITLRNVFAEFGEGEFGGGLSRRAAFAPFRRRRGRRWLGSGLRCGSLGGFDRCGLRGGLRFWRGGLRGRLGRGFRSGSIFDGEDYLADFDLVAFFDANFLHGSGHGRRYFEDGFVGFEFHDRLAGADRRARGDHEAHEVALFDIFSQLGEFEFDHRVRSFVIDSVSVIDKNQDREFRV